MQPRKQISNRNRTSDVPKKSASSFSYHSNRSNSDVSTGRYSFGTKPENVDVNRGKWWHKIPTYVAVGVLVAAFIYAITLTTTPEVKIVDNTSQSFMQPISVYKQAAHNLLSGSILNSTKVTINTDSIASKLMKQFPELNGVSIVLPLTGRQPILEIRPSQSIIILSNSQGRYVINQQGNAIIKLNTVQLNKAFNLPVVTDDSGLVVNLGNQVLPVDTIAFINTVIGQFKAKNISIQSMTLADVPYELDVRVSGEPYFIKFNLQEDPLYEVGTYFATEKELTTLKATPSQYIDIRIPGKAYYI